MPYTKSGMKKPYTKANIKKAKAGKGGLSMSKPVKVAKKVVKKKMKKGYK